jgi:hypothetical protein
VGAAWVGSLGSLGACAAGKRGQVQLEGVAAGERGQLGGSRPLEKTGAESQLSAGRQALSARGPEGGAANAAGVPEPLLAGRALQPHADRVAQGREPRGQAAGAARLSWGPCAAQRSAVSDARALSRRPRVRVALGAAPGPGTCQAGRRRGECRAQGPHSCYASDGSGAEDPHPYNTMAQSIPLNPHGTIHTPRPAWPNPHSPHPARRSLCSPAMCLAKPALPMPMPSPETDPAAGGQCRASCSFSVADSAACRRGSSAHSGGAAPAPGGSSLAATPDSRSSKVSRRAAGSPAGRSAPASTAAATARCVRTRSLARSVPPAGQADARHRRCPACRTVANSKGQEALLPSLPPSPAALASHPDAPKKQRTSEVGTQLAQRAGAQQLVRGKRLASGCAQRIEQLGSGARVRQALADGGQMLHALGGAACGGGRWHGAHR